MDSTQPLDSVIADAKAKLSAGDTAAALEHLRFHQIDGWSDPTFISLLGVTCCMAGQPDEGLSPLLRAVSLAPSSQAHYNLGQCYQLLGNFASARASYEQALTFDPTYAKAQAGLQSLPPADQVATEPAPVAVVPEPEPDPPEPVSHQEVPDPLSAEEREFLRSQSSPRFQPKSRQDIKREKAAARQIGMRLLNAVIFCPLIGIVWWVIRIGLLTVMAANSRVEVLALAWDIVGIGAAYGAGIGIFLALIGGDEGEGSIAGAILTPVIMIFVKSNLGLETGSMLYGLMLSILGGLLSGRIIGQWANRNVERPTTY